MTHFDPQNPGRLSLANWMAEVVRELEVGHRAPRRAPRDLMVRARVTERSGQTSRYRGTIFDARLADIAVRRFGTFADATRALGRLGTFVGVSDEMTALIRECRWQDVLEFRDRRANEQRASDREVVLESGILTKSAELLENDEKANAVVFARLRQRAEAEGRIIRKNPT